jgi:hypothetical protein
MAMPTRLDLSGRRCGLVNGDTLSGALATSATTRAMSAPTASARARSRLEQLRAELCSADLTVTQRAITVTADAKSRAYGDANPALTYQVGGSGSSTAIRCRGAGDIGDTASNVGDYGITQGTLAASAQLRADLYGANLTVGQRAITETADAKSRAYGDANPALTYQVGGAGLANGDTVSGALATSATVPATLAPTASPQGRWRFRPTTRLTYTGNNLTVGQRALT